MREKPLRQIVAGEQGRLIQEIRFALSPSSVPASAKIARIDQLIRAHDTLVKSMIEEWFIMEGEKAKKEVKINDRPKEQTFQHEGN